MKCLILGASGMAGHLISIYLKEKGHNVAAFTRRPFKYCENILGDISDGKLLQDIICKGGYDVVINCIGILNQNAESNKYLAVYLNSYLPHYLSHVTKDSKTKIIQMSTDCVFSGKVGNYNENTFKDGETFYDRSKALGEIENSKDLTFRCSIIGPDVNKNGIGLFNWFMSQNGSISGYTKAIWTGVTTLTLAKAMEMAVKEDLTGIYNLVNNKVVNKFDLIGLFNNHMKDGKITVTPSGTVNLNKSLINNRKDFSFKVPDYEQMVIEMKEWIYNHKKLYPHYFV